MPGGRTAATDWLPSVSQPVKLQDSAEKMSAFLLCFMRTGKALSFNLTGHFGQDEWISELYPGIWGIRSSPDYTMLMCLLGGRRWRFSASGARDPRGI